MICLVLAGRDLEENHRLLSASAADLAELRVDLLAETPTAAELRAFARGVSRPLVLTWRRREDGGAYEVPAGGDDERPPILEAALEAFDYLDLEADLAETPAGARLLAAARRSGAQVIVSRHDFAGTPAGRGAVDAVLESLARTGGEGAIPKLACTPTCGADLAALARSKARFGRRLLVGMGSFGVVTRILPGHFGSLWSFAAAGDAVAPGQLSVSDLAEIYRAREVTPATPVFAVLGDPVSHSRSPHYHNPLFRDGGYDAVYVPVRLESTDALPVLARELGIRGVSVTVPHKKAAAGLATRRSPEVVALGVANTLLFTPDREIRAENTDVAGFLAPLDSVPSRATVIGAGGAARSVVYALVSRGSRVLILNRSIDRGRDLAVAAGAWGPGTVDVCPLDSSAPVADYRDLIVNTTTVGMARQGVDPDEDAIPFYSFRGDELVYDIVYTPEVTRLLRRAGRAGARCISGRAMFEAQAAEQQRMFRALLADPIAPPR